MRCWLLLLFVVACSPAQREWRAAKRVGTADAYRPIANNLRHKKRAKAYKRAEALDWADAEAADSSREWKAYVSHHPSSSRVSEARKRREAAEWAEVQRADSRTTYESFLARNGASPHASEARAAIDELAWKEATVGGDADAYARYIIRYPNGPYLDEAKRLRQLLFWEEAVADDRPAAYRTFVERFPQNEHAAEAQTILDGFKFSGVAIRVVAHSVFRPDSASTYQRELQATLGDALKGSNFKVEWLPLIESKGRTINPLAGLITKVSEDHAALVIEVREKRGASYEPDGYATDIEAIVHLVPPGRAESMDTREVDATTTDDVRGESLQALHLSAQRALGDAILAAGFEFDTWRR